MGLDRTGVSCLQLPSKTMFVHDDCWVAAVASLSNETTAALHHDSYVCYEDCSIHRSPKRHTHTHMVFPMRQGITCCTSIISYVCTRILLGRKLITKSRGRLQNNAARRWLDFPLVAHPTFWLTY